MSKDQLYEKIYELLQSSKIKEACRTVAEYELNSPNPRGLLDNVQDYWQNYPHPRACHHLIQETAAAKQIPPKKATAVLS